MEFSFYQKLKKNIFTKKRNVLKINAFLIGSFLSFLPLNISHGIIEASTIQNKEASILNNNHYILGPGDILSINLPYLDSHKNLSPIDVNGYLKLERIGNVYAKDLTIEQLQDLLLVKYQKFLRFPDVEIKVIKPKPLNVFIKGEIKRPGLYTFKNNDNNIIVSGETNSQDSNEINNVVNPTLFDLIQAAGGITFYSDLENIKITRDMVVTPFNIEKKKTTINFLSFFLEGDFNKNINLLNGDIIEIKKGSESITEKTRNVFSSNLNPDSIVVYVTGAVKEPGAIQLRNGATLNESINLARNFEVYRGGVEFARLNPDGTMDKRKIKYKKNNNRGSYNNPILLSGDMINVNESIIGNTFDKVNRTTSPFIGIFSLYSLIKAL